MMSISSINPLNRAYDMAAQRGVGAGEAGGVGAADLQGGVGLDSASGVQSGSDSFSNVLGRMVQEVNEKQSASTDALSALQSGQNVSLHQAVIAMEEANVSFQLMVEVRNKLLDSYQELMRMQI
jgi:flagellar hook-basal body complex protein FliE